MGSSVSIAKESADIILTNNDFEAAVRSVMWGRNIYHNVKRFLQFQMTVNVSALLTIFIGIILFNQQPLNSVQLLWINLIMDTFAALALASEPPLPQVIQGPPFEENVSILTLTIWRQVVGISLWNVIVMILLMFFGRIIGGLPDYDRSTPTVIPSMPENYPSNPLTAEDLAY
jgi:magnesium-transporting ATPase (P-type)